MHNLKWYHHICRIQHIASLCAYSVLHCFSLKNVWTLLRAYFTNVRSKLEYNTPVWCPYLKKDIIIIESVQCHFTCQICTHCNIFFCSYYDCPEKLNIKSLEYHRVEYDLFLMYKICHNLSDLNFYNFFHIATLVIICINMTGLFSLYLILNTISSKISSLTVYQMFGINSLKIFYLLQAYLVLKSVLKNLTSTVLLHLSTEYYTLFLEFFFSLPISMLVCVQSTMVLYFQIK